MISFDFDHWVNTNSLAMFASWLRRERFDSPEALTLLREDDLTGAGFALGDVRRLMRAVTQLDEATRAGATQPTIEKRIISALFCDLVGSTEFVRRADHVDLRNAFAKFQQRCTDIIHHYDGYVARYVGDGVLAYFGYPSTGEDDPARAINAGLEITSYATSLDNTRPEHPIRVGIATGLVAVGNEVAYQSPQGAIAIGESVHLAARLQSIADPNSVIVCDRTHNETLGLFATSRCSDREFKGFEDSQAWQVDGRRHITSQFRSDEGRKLSAFTGRRKELQALMRRWETARQGTGSVMLLTGEAGMGKSRLLHEISTMAAEDDCERMPMQCLPYFSSTPLHPLAMSLVRQNKPSSAGVERRIARFIRWIGLDETEGSLARALLLPTLAPELFTSGDDVTALTDTHQEAALQAIARGFVRRASDKPVMMLIEDMHWSDPTFRRLIAIALKAARDYPVAFFITGREPQIAERLGIESGDHFHLDPLSRDEVMLLARQAAPERALRDNAIERIIQLSSGNPLWAEELARSPVDIDKLSSATASGSESDAVYSAIRAQLDQINAPRIIVNAASLMVGTIDPNTISAVCNDNPLTVIHYLDTLYEQGILVRHGHGHGHGHQHHYSFRHELVRVHVYDSIFETERNDLHLQFAEALVADSGGAGAAAPEQIAYHFAAGDDLERAVEYWIQASQYAATTGSSAEALALIDETQARLRNSRHPDRRGLEGTVLVALGDARRSVYGTGHSNTLDAYRNAVERCVDAKHRSYPDALYGLAISAWMQSRFNEAENAANKLVQLEGGDDRTRRRRLIGSMLLGMIGISCGELGLARTHLRRACAASFALGDGSVLATAQFPSMAYTYLGWVEAIDGDKERARDAIAFSLSSAARESRVSLFYAIANACCFDFIIDDADAMVRRVEQLLEFAADDPVFRNDYLTKFYSALLKTRTRATAGQAVDALCAAFDEFEEDEVETPVYGAMVAHAAIQAGYLDAAVRITNAALVHAEKTRETWCVPILERLRDQATGPRDQQFSA